MGAPKLHRCPACGYYGFDGRECFDCGYRRAGLWLALAEVL